MSRTTPSIRSFTARLIAHERRGQLAPDTTIPTAFQIFEKLRPQLATLMGNGGYRALLTRAHALAQLDTPWLRTIRVKPNGTLEEVNAMAMSSPPEQLAGGRVALLSEMLGLLVEFIGPNLTLTLVSEVWPDIDLNTSEFVHGERHERKKGSSGNRVGDFGAF